MHRGAWGSCLALLLATAWAACGDDTNPWSVQLPSSSRTLAAPFSVDIQGTSTDGQYAISIKANSGTLTQNGQTIDVVVANQIPYGGNLVLYDLYGANSEIILTSWAYCRNGFLTALYLESTRGNSDFTPSDISGSCVVTTQPANPVFNTPSQCITINPASQVPSLSGGDTLSLRNGVPGTVVLHDEPFNVLPYAIVNCANCPADSRGGWVEVHTVLAAKATSDVCLGIFYLFVQCRATATLQYVQCFRGNQTSQEIPAGYDLSPTIGGASPGQCCTGSQCQGLNALAASSPASSASGPSSSVSASAGSSSSAGANSSADPSSSMSASASSSGVGLSTSGVPPATSSTIAPGNTVTTPGGAASPSESRTGEAAFSQKSPRNWGVVYIIALIATMFAS